MKLFDLHGEVALVLTGTVTSQSDLAAAVERIEKELGALTIAVNNAGIAGAEPAETLPMEKWQKIYDVNVSGVFLSCQAEARVMLPRRKGSIINIASMSGSIVNWPQAQAAYNASKAAVIHLTKSLASEWAARGVRVNCVSPGYIGTAMTEAGFRDHPDWGKVWLEMTPMGRMGTPADVANAVWYLASDAAAFATGTDLIVDGGYTVR